MKRRFELTKFYIRAFAGWLDEAMHHLAVYGLCLMVFGGVYWVGHVSGDAAGSARTETAFETCGQAHCWSDYFLSREPAP